MEGWLRDARHAVRALARDAAFSITVILTLALAIAANVAIFTIVNALMFRPLPFPDLQRLMFVSASPLGTPRYLGASYPDYVDWRRQATSFESMGLARPQNFSLGRTAGAEQVSGARITASLFDVFGIRPAAGRAFDEADDRPGGDRVVVLGQDLWQRLFDADPSIIGRDIRLDGEPRTVIGVMPRDFAYPDHAELWIPLAAQAAAEQRSAHSSSVIGRLRAGVEVNRARAEMQSVAADLRRAYAATNANMDVLVTPLGEGRGPKGLAFAFLVSLAAGAFLVLIACANVANLLLARTARRSKEFAIRSAIGATRRQVFRLQLTETLLLALPGGGVALLLGRAARDALLGMVPDGIPVWMRFDIDWRVFTFTAGMTGAAAVLATLSPALRASRRTNADELKESGPGDGAHHRIRDGMVVAEIALTLVLLVGAGLMTRSFLNVAAIEPGFPTRNLLTARLPVSSGRYAGDQRAALCQRVRARLSPLAGVTAVACASALPVADGGRAVGYSVGDGQVPPGSERLVQRTAVSDEYFGTLRLPILRGRPFDRRDGAGTPSVAVVTRAFADRHWPHEDAIGKWLQFSDGGTASPWITIVGVAADIHTWRLGGDNLPLVYVPLSQAPGASLNVVLRSASETASLGRMVRAEVAALDADLPVVDLMTLDAAVDRSLWAERLFMRLFEAFGATAICLALVGIFGVVSYSIAQRFREIGIRVALGASPGAVWRLVVGHAARLAVIGVAIGVVAAPLLTRAMTRILYAVTPYDPITFVGVGVLLLALSAATACLPARRAARMDALAALRRS